MTDAASFNSLKPVRLWLFTVAALVFAMVLVGGATRLTESGLSITEWKPVTGALPPLNADDWEAEFARYRQSPQYELINRGMALSDFKTIYWWEWGHRQLGRLIGAAMLLPWLYFVATGRLRGRLMGETFAIGCFIGLQGAIGWLMVASGLKPGMSAVAPLKLMLHLVCACLIFAWLLVVAVRLKPAQTPPDRRLNGGAALLFIALIIQIMLGALVAGNRAGLAYNTWPLMDGGFAPAWETLFARPVLLENLIDNGALVQLNHRLGAYALVLVALWHFWRARAVAGPARRRAGALCALVLAQALLGIVTLVLVTPLALALLHQALALLILAVASVHLARQHETVIEMRH